MLLFFIYAMVYIGSALMVFNVYSYIKYARRFGGVLKGKRIMLYIPIFLLVMFLLGYIAVGIWGRPDLIVSGILFGGSIFVFIIFTVLQNISVEIQKREQLDAKLFAAEESNRAKNVFLSSMSHEMRTPLNAIIGLDTLLLKDSTLSADSRHQAERIGISANHLLELINNILDMNSIDASNLRLNEAPFSLRNTVERVNAILQDQCREKGLSYESSFIGEIADHYVGDELNLKRILINVLENAAKYTIPPGTVTFTTEEIAAEGDERVIRFTVRDTGVGMDKEFLPNLFYPFSQGDSTNTNLGGSGLGLAVTKHIVERMNGTIKVSSEKGVGSLFVITVKLHAFKSVKAEDPSSVSSDDVDILKGKHILIVEDIDINAEIVAELLALEDMTSERAENGKRAVEIFSEKPENAFDAILMDLRMPVMDGLESARIIRSLDRADAKTIPILALTANAFEEDVRNSLEAGMNEHLTKPVDAEKLFNSLRWHFLNNSSVK